MRARVGSNTVKKCAIIVSLFYFGLIGEVHQREKLTILFSIRGSMSREESEDTGYVRRDVKEAVWSYLPGLPDDLLTTMLDELGIESIEDLTLLEERDLVKYLKPIPSRKLVKGHQGWTCYS
ncbi:hypothetical protein UPYG_G00279630 [Umbra pygmaea]|uniref:Uncharacterized protein n=1 Tax=Umbra pygmaea TaxID=75934 RepID=A0ABD0W7C4_UMBPY